MSKKQFHDAQAGLISEVVGSTTTLEKSVEFSEYSKYPFSPENPLSFRYQGDVYKPLKKLGQGVFGEVWLCSSGTLKSLVLKREIVMSGGLYDEGKSFEREAILNKKVYGLGEMSGDPHDKSHPHYLLMNLIDGINLERFFQTCLDNPFYENELLRIWILFAAATIQLHEHRLVHCDLHSGNVMISPSRDRVSLIDFGYALPIGALREDCAIAVVRQSRYPFRPPETFSDLKNPIVFAQQNQDGWALGHHLSRIKKVVSGKHDRPLSEIISQLMKAKPIERIELKAAIYKLVVGCFQHQIAKNPVSMTKEWMIIVSAILQMRMNQFVLAMDKKPNSSHFIHLKEQYETLLISLRTGPLSLYQQKHRQAFLHQLLDIFQQFQDVTLVFLETIIRSFFPPASLSAVSPVSTQPVVYDSRRKQIAEVNQQRLRSTTPILTVGVRPAVLRSNTPPVCVQRSRIWSESKTPVGVRPKSNLQLTRFAETKKPNYYDLS